MMLLQKHTRTTCLLLHSKHHIARSLATEAHTRSYKAKKEGDISSVFQSLSGAAAEPLPLRFANIKHNLIAGNEEAIQSSWNRLLAKLTSSTNAISKLGPAAVPTIEYSSIEFQKGPDQIQFAKDLKERGVAVIRGVIQEDQALAWKEEIKEYIKRNPQTKAFPQHDPQVYELYWSPSQVQARAHPNMLTAQKFAMSHFHSSSPTAHISTKIALTYADRLRIRQPGDAGFALGPHVDAGSVERWEPNGYGLGNVYSPIFAGNWETYDPWESSCRLNARSDLYNGAGSCSMFRMFQGWLSMSSTGPWEGTLLVNPLLKEATAYYLLRPFFKPIIPKIASLGREAFLEVSNWVLEPEQSSTLQGATPGLNQELSDSLHPHLELGSTMVHMPHVRPGDYVLWHCDTIHAVDKVHAGKGDSSVLYIPACPLTAANVKYLKRQRDTFLAGLPGPDFPGGIGESGHVGRADLGTVGEGMGAMGLERLEVGEEASEGEKGVVEMANRLLGF